MVFARELRFIFAIAIVPVMLLAPNTGMAETNDYSLTPDYSIAAAAGSAAPLVFSVFPGGGNGEIGNVAPPDSALVIERLNQLRALCVGQG